MSATGASEIKKLERHLDHSSNRDIMGFVRGRCLSNHCSCISYESDPSRYKLSYAATADDDDQYSEELGKNIVRKNPHNDPSILNCRNCGCENIAHEIDVFGDHLEKGNDYFHRRLYDLAIIEYSKSSASILHSLKSYSNRAACYLALSSFSAALADCEQALRLENDNVKVLNRKAHALLGLKRFQESVKTYKLVLKIDAQNSIARDALIKLNIYDDVSKPAVHGIQTKDTKEMKDAWTQTEPFILVVETKTLNYDDDDTETTIKESLDFFLKFESSKNTTENSFKFAFPSDDDDDDSDADNSDDGSDELKSFEESKPLDDGDDEEDEDSCWAELWEREQEHTRTNSSKNKVKPEVRAKVKIFDEIITSVLSFEELCQISSLTKSTATSFLGDEDLHGTRRGRCLTLNCSKVCTQFKRVSTSSILPNVSQELTRTEYENKVALLLASQDGEFCAQCACSYECHEDNNAFKRRIERDKKTAEKESNILRMKKNKRLANVQNARVKVREAKENEVILEKSSTCILTGARRSKCNECNCKQFCTYNNSSFFNTNAELFLFCWSCGCDNNAHSVDADWQAERDLELKTKQEEAKRWQQQQQYHHHRHHQQQQTRRKTNIFEEDREDLMNLKVLGLEGGESKEAMTKRYKMLALKYHPDKKGGSATKFVEITNAFRSLISKK